MLQFLRKNGLTTLCNSCNLVCDRLFVRTSNKRTTNNYIVHGQKAIRVGAPITFDLLKTNQVF